MKVLSTKGLTKLIQLIKSTFFSRDEAENVIEMDVEETLTADLKTINGESLIGQGDIVIPTSTRWGDIKGTLSKQTDLKEALDSKQDTLTPGTNITIEEDTQTGDLVISSTAQESFFRGNFNEWLDVPTDTSLYVEDIHGNRIPKNTDFIVIEDASQFVPSGELMNKLVIECLGVDVRITDETGVSKEYNYTYCPNRFVAIDDYYSLQYEYGAPGIWYIKTNDGSTIIVKGETYQSGQVRLFTTEERGTTLNAGMPPSAGQYQGAWRFAYYGVWATAGLTGWTPQYKIENTLPIADSQTLGIAKLYTTTGSNTDGSMDQNSITTALGTKQDTLTEGTGISIDENNVISATFSESYFRGKFSTWNTVPTDYRNYYPDYTGSTKPTRTDYMVVEDPSGYIKPGDPIILYNEPMYAGTAYARFVFGATDITLNHNQVSQAGEAGIIIGTVGNQIKVTYNTPTWKITPLDVPVIVDGVEKPVGEIAYSWGYQDPAQETVQKELNFKGQGGYVGTWRFSYQSDNWDATGKNGWYPEYQIEDVLPIATDIIAGITKLYTTTGSNTDGTMDQNSITTELGNKISKYSTLPSVEDHLGEIVEFTGTTTEDYTNGYFYKATSETTPGELQVAGTSSSTLMPDDITIDSNVWSAEVTTAGTYVFNYDGTNWSLDNVVVDLATYGITIDSGAIVSPSDNFEIVYTPEETTYSWVNINVQPAPDMSSKVDKVSTADRVYGTDSSGNQTTYDKNSFGQVDDVQIHGDSKVVSKIANLSVVEQLTTMPAISEDNYGRIVQYIGATTQDYTHGYFYQAEALRVDSSESVSADNATVTIANSENYFAWLTRLQTILGASRPIGFYILKTSNGTTYTADVYDATGTLGAASGSNNTVNDWGLSFSGFVNYDSETGTGTVLHLDVITGWSPIPVQPDAEPITNAEIDAMWE